MDPAVVMGSAVKVGFTSAFSIALPEIPRAAIVKCHKPGGLKQQKSFLSQSGGQKSEISAWAGPLSQWWLKLRGIPRLAAVITQSVSLFHGLLSVCLHPNSLHTRTRHIGFRAGVISPELSDIRKAPAHEGHLAQEGTCGCLGRWVNEQAES